MAGTCYECGSAATVQHHVVPVSLGGTRTLPLCRKCHGLVHSPGQALALGSLNHIARKSKHLTWQCEVCDQTIACGAGYIACHTSEALDRLSRWKEFSEDHRDRKTGWTAYCLADAPMIPSARWHVLHRICDPQPESWDDYWIAVERAQTVEQLLSWTIHLAEKSWYSHTNWDDLIRKVAGKSLA